jgi:type I restriction-modification system DNA methylase subunit
LSDTQESFQLFNCDISQLEKRLWESADQLRANSNLSASEYSNPVLGLIFLRYADHKFTVAQQELVLITKTVALTSAQKTAMISIPSHVSEWLKLRSLCLAWRREGSLPHHYTAWLGAIRP